MKRTQRARRHAHAAPVATPAAPKRTGVSLTALTHAAPPDHVQAFVVAKPLNGVVPQGARLALDGAGNFAASSMYDELMQSLYSEGLSFAGYPALAQMTQRAEYRRPAEILAKHMTRKWIRFVTKGDDDKTDKISALEDEFERLNVQGVFRKAIELDGFFGRSQIYIDTGAKFEDRLELMAPLALSANKIGKGSLKALTVIEPVWTYPNQYNSTNPLAADFYQPKSWFVLGSEIHASRLLTIIGRQVPDMLKPAYAFGGLSLSQMAKPYIDNWLRTRQSVSDLIHSFSVSGLKTNLGSILQGGQGSDVANRVALFNQHRDNRGMLIVDKDTEEFFNVSTPLSGLDHLQAQSQEHMSAVTGIPLSILLGITPTGLNASSEGEIRTFYDWIESQQAGHISPFVEYVLRVAQLSLFGEIDPGIGFAWEPLWSMDAAEAATVRKTDADTDVVLINAGVISPEESRKRVASDEDSPYAGLDINDLPEPPQDPEGEGNGPPSNADEPKEPTEDPDAPAPNQTPTVGASDEQARASNGQFGSGGAEHDGWGSAFENHTALAAAHQDASAAHELHAGDHKKGSPQHTAHKTASRLHARAAEGYRESARLGGDGRAEGRKADAAHAASERADQLRPASGAKLAADADQPRADNGQFGIGGHGAASASQALKDLYADAMAPGHANKTVEIAPVSAETATLAKEKAGIDIAGFMHTVDLYSIRHTLKEHGTEETEKPRGQLPVTEADIARLDDVVGKPDRIVFAGKNRRKQDTIAYVKQFADGSVLAVEEVRTGRHTLALASLRKYPAAKGLTAIASSVLSNARSDGGDAGIVHDCTLTGKESDDRIRPNPEPAAE